MVNKRILGLDDGYHATVYVDEYGAVWGRDKEVMEILAQPHQDTYQIRIFSLEGEWSETLEKYGENTVFQMFDFLSGDAVKPENISQDLIFDLFWESEN